jgi:hypothetical protein
LKTKNRYLAGFFGPALKARINPRILGDLFVPLEAEKTFCIDKEK